MKEGGRTGDGARRLRHVVALLLLVGFGLALPLVFLEGYPRAAAIVRAVKTAKEVAQPGSFYQTDPLTGSWHVPKATGYWTKSCFSVKVAMNSRGLRDVEHDLAKPPGTYRVVVLGDSYAEALQVPLEDSFPKVLERELQTRAGPTPRIEVINLGVSGFGTDQELLALRHYGRQYEPDLVVLAFLTGNDVRNNYYKLEEAANGAPVQKPYFLLDRSGRLVMKTPAPQRQSALAAPWWKRVGRKFYAYNWLGERYNRFRMQLEQVRALRVKEDVSRAGSAGGKAGELQAPSLRAAAGAIDNGVYLTNYPPEWEYAWRITEALIVEVSREAARAGAGFLLVSLTDPMQLTPNEGTLLNTEKPVRLLADITRRHGIQYLPLLPIFKNQMEKKGYALTDLHFSCDGHWTALGHRLAAGAISERIYQRFLRR